MPQPTRLLPGGDAKTGMQTSDMTPPECFTTGDQSELIHTFFTTEDGSTFSGVWECAPSKMDIDAYPVHETMTVISGSVTVTDDSGNAETFTAGDTFTIPKGTKCVWEITQTLRKFFMITS